MPQCAFRFVHFVRQKVLYLPCCFKSISNFKNKMRFFQNFLKETIAKKNAIKHYVDENLQNQNAERSYARNLPLSFKNNKNV